MVNNEEIYGKNLGGAERHDSEECIVQLSSPEIIYLESDRKTLEKAWLENEEGIARLVEDARLPVRLPDDRLEFLLTIAMFFALLLGLYVGLIELGKC
jgi:hypothetical protein